MLCVKDVVLSTEAVPWTGLPLSLRSLRAFTTQSSTHRRMPRFLPQGSPAMQIASDSLLESVTNSIASQEVPDSASWKKKRQNLLQPKKRAPATKIYDETVRIQPKTFGSRGVEPCSPASHLKVIASWFVNFFKKNARDALFIRGKQGKLHPN